MKLNNFTPFRRNDENWEVWAEDEDGVSRNVVEFLERDMAIRIAHLLDTFSHISDEELPSKSDIRAALELLSLELEKRSILERHDKR